MDMNVSNSSSSEHHVKHDALGLIHLVVCIISNIIAAFGNAFVIAVIAKKQNLRTVSNTFVLSLAATDLLVAVLILPLGIQYLYFGRWYLGREACVFWVTTDVLLITASILSLCAISIDRFRAIKQPIKYAVRRTPILAGKIITGVWVVSTVTSIPAVFVIDFTEEGLQCGFKRNIAFTICSSIVSFYGPLLVVLLVYIQIYRVAKERANRVTGTDLTAISTTESASEKERPKLPRRTTLMRLKSTLTRSKLNYNPDDPKSESLKISAARERKAARTIFVIVGVFIICWLPFFIMHVTLALCSSCTVSERIYVMIAWVGYWNSAVNPVIYTLFNKDFRNTFRQILKCKLPS